MALYHKYRPQTFADVIGQEHIVKTLTNQIKTGKVAHAYLFSGPRGIGKTTTARILAKSVNCANRKKDDSEPCNSCISCQEISGSRSIDVIEIDAASHTGVDNVRENIIDNAQFRPTKSKYKIFIIDEAHMLSVPAFNALLKTLEEPPAHVIFILATTELHKLPETIISRCQRFDFHKIPFEIMKKHLEGIAKKEEIKIDKEVIERLINKSEGAVRDAVSLLDQIMAGGEKHITADIASLILPNVEMEKTLELAEKIINKNMPDSLKLLNSLSSEGTNLYQLSHDMLELMRIIMVMQASGQSKNIGADLDDKIFKEIKKISSAISPPEMVKLIDLWLSRHSQIKTSPLPQLPLEMAIIEWCSQPQIMNQQPVAENATEEKTTIAEKIKNMVSKNSVTINQVEEKWGEFMARIEKDHPSLSFILKIAEIHSLENDTLKISVGHGFHCDKLMEKNCRNALESIWHEILKEKIKIEAIVEAAEDRQKQEEEIKKLASSLGGEIVS